MDLALNNLQRLIYQKSQPTNQLTKAVWMDHSISIKLTHKGALSAGAVEYTDCFSAEG